MPAKLPASKLSVVALLLLGCTGHLTGPDDGTLNQGPAGGSGPGVTPPASVDPGRVGLHRLNNTEYDNTVRDLLGTASKPTVVGKFLAEESNHFDNTANALGMTSSQYDKYLTAATDLMVEALANPAQSARFMTCTPAVAADPCARQIIETFGLQVFRRPLEASQVDLAMAVYDADVARGNSGTEALGQALRAMMASAHFLYRIELAPEPSSTAPHPLSGYELASRLSYLHWSSMPDAALFESAKNGELATASALEASVDRLLADAKASAFVESFAGQWLDIRALLTQSVSTTVFPSWSQSLADAMIAEGQLWFQEFLQKDLPLSQWFTADFNYVNDELAQHYGFPSPGSGAQFTRVQVTTDRRQGYLGLASFLTHTSVPSRTSPTERGAWILTDLLCDPPPLPPPDIAPLEDAKKEGDTSPEGAENVRERLERHRSEPGCSGCHQLFDPFGLGLERYDGIGNYREAYGNGDAIAPDGLMPDGTPFAGPEELGALVGQDPRFDACVASKLYTYALGRELEAHDTEPMKSLQSRWAARGPTLRNLMKEVVVSDAFRFSRGEAE